MILGPDSYVVSALLFLFVNICIVKSVLELCGRDIEGVVCAGDFLET